MVKRFLLFISAVLLYGCSTIPKYVRNNPNSFQRVARIGVFMKEDENHNVVIDEITKNYPAERAGLVKGDMLESIDDKIIKTPGDVQRYVEGKSAEDILKIRIQRDNKIRQIELKPKETWFLKTFYRIGKILESRKKVSLVVVVLEPKNPGASAVSAIFDREIPNIEEWKNSTKITLYTEYENKLLNWFSNHKDFCLVDRQRIDDILKELKYNASGIMSSEIQNKLGEILGVTHFLYIDLCRYYDGGVGVDIVNQRLIEVETGRVLENIEIKTKS
ncbi:MAG: hypothetical protein COS68_02595 [Elusimicrobia bacterium CG06_land_8_20_14_3_00_38_11]|nr:MAG: hypothetical protein COS68_02595 [Elusimicrobia bacterium CG06_land_8_20_14_3_00_38_11]